MLKVSPAGMASYSRNLIQYLSSALKHGGITTIIRYRRAKCHHVCERCKQQCEARLSPAGGEARTFSGIKFGEKYEASIEKMSNEMV